MGFVEGLSLGELSYFGVQKQTKGPWSPHLQARDAQAGVCREGKPEYRNMGVFLRAFTTEIFVTDH
jgi:hypothetical protein